MKTAVGNPEEFENNKPDKKFQKQLPGEGYKKRPNPPESIHIEVPNRKDNRDLSPKTPSMIAKCGHEDALGYFAGTVCGKCARKNHKKAMGK